MSAALAIGGLSVRFGGVRALHEVDLQVEAGRLVGLIGPNGAGKTTLIDAVSGFVPYAGTVALDGRDLKGLPPHRRTRAGLARTWQAGELFEDLTVADNLDVALSRHFAAAGWGRPRRRARNDAWIQRALALVGIEDLAEAMPAELSQGLRKLVGVARGLVNEPRVLCLDEPAAGLNTTESQELGRRLRDVVAAGTSVLLVDHDMGLVMSVCDHVVVLEFGERIAAGGPDEVRSDQRVISAYLGGAAERQDDEVPSQGRPLAPQPRPLGDAGTVKDPPAAEVALRVEGLVAGYDGIAAVQGIDLSVGAGEIVAVLGANGAGKTTLLRAISGLIDAIDGSVQILGRDVRRLSPTARARLGLSHVPEGRGLFYGLTVAEHFRLGPRGEQLDADLAYEYFPALEPLRNRKAGLLSGGEQQMLAVARGLLRRPRLLLIDEMSLGLAPVIVERLLPVIRRYATETGCGVVLVEQHVELGLEVAHRGYVLAHGQVLLSGDAATLRDDPQLLVSSYMGAQVIEAGSEQAS